MPCAIPRSERSLPSSTSTSKIPGLDMRPVAVIRALAGLEAP